MVSLNQVNTCRNDSSNGNGHVHAVDEPTKRTKRTAKRPTSLFQWCMQRQLEISLSLILGVMGLLMLFPPVSQLSTHYTPAPSFHYTTIPSRFLFLSFRLPESNLYYKGRDDAYFIACWVVLFWFIREAAMKFVMKPFARWTGVKEKRSVVRFAEQGYGALYATVFWLLGLYIMQTSSYANLNTKEFWIGYPHDALTPLAKFYYLAQTAFWIQQILVINLEARRKDYTQMFVHHVITIWLMTFSYVFNYTRVGNAILTTMDLVDIVLPVAKLFKYCGRQKIADALFIVFLVSWIVTRHVIFGRILYSVYFEVPQIIPFGLDAAKGYFLPRWLFYTFCVLLTALQGLLFMWLAMILKVVWMVLRGDPAADTRSDDEGEDDEEEEEVDTLETSKAQLINGESIPEPRLNGSTTPPLERKKDR